MTPPVLDKPKTEPMKNETLIDDLVNKTAKNQHEIARFQRKRRPSGPIQWVLWSIGWPINNPEKSSSKSAT